MKLVHTLSILFSLAASQSTLCDDAYECESQDIATTYVYCYGYYSCDEANIDTSYLYAYGDYALYQADAGILHIFN